MARPRAKLDRCGEADLVTRRLNTAPPGARRERLLAVQMGLMGELGLEAIAQAVGRSRATIQTWFDTYRRGGVDALLYDARSDNPGRPSELSGAALAELEQDLAAGRWRSVPQLQRWLAQTHGVKLALSSLYDRLGKIGARLRVPRKSHVKKDPAAALEFRSELAAKLTALALPPGRPVRLWVLDEMRYGLHGFTRRVWGRPGHRPVVPTQQKYQWGFLYGAVSVGLSRSEFLLTETMDQTHSREFYRQISRSDPAALHVLLQDGAGFHLPDGHPVLPDNVRVVTLPAYSPELNPIEGLWDQFKDTLCNRVFDTLTDLEAVLQDEVQRFWQDARRVHSLVFDWLLAQANTSSRPVIPLS
jgi:transposase